jgi:hypothetical protein
MVIWIENVNDKTKNTVEEGCDLSDSDDGCIDLVSECGNMRVMIHKMIHHCKLE